MPSKLKPEKTGGCAPPGLIDFAVEEKSHHRLAPRYDAAAAGMRNTPNQQNGEGEA
ncbi:hypothetical protein [Nitrosospira sp. Nsp11]|uniref:hypothetical protein n=1 Tax=Nitrosospira sp. Nsp11 TaxID=1855338 RepID=UPI0015B4A80E|nr:hypothetical protein [Nitrosospira sp. Nsp11]